MAICRPNSFAMLFLACNVACSTVFAQIPSLVPEKTVNPATGEMRFSMRLGVAKGVNGLDFPIDLYYKGGVRTEQAASPVGLGFGIGPGGISRKVVHIPDDITGPDKVFYDYDDPVCFVPYWKQVLASVIEGIVSLVLSLLSVYTGCPFVAVADLVVSTIVNVALECSLLFIGPMDFRSGGDHTPSYDFVEGDRTGFLFGGKQDSPDVYTISTPYLSGQLVWVGDAETGHFALRTGTGSTLPGANAVIVEYDKATDVFTITLQDGKRLFFEQQQRLASYTKHYTKAEDDGDWCFMYYYVGLKQASTTEWLLTKVLAPDYVDGNGDLYPLNSRNKGGWIVFDWGQRGDEEGLEICQRRTQYMRTEPNGYSWVYVGKVSESYDDVEMNVLSRIYTPVQRVEYNWVDREDDVWSYTNSSELWQKRSAGDPWTPYKTQRLASITIADVEADHIPVRTIEFETGYDLRPMSVGAFVHAEEEVTWHPLFLMSDLNPDARALTLRSVIVRSLDETESMSVDFSYVDANPRGYPVLYTDDQTQAPWHQPMDLWGYYFPNNAFDSDPETFGDFNWYGTHGYAHNSDDGEPWARAWSLQSVALPGGATIQWEYEANRYDKANGEGVTSVVGSSVPKYGGGVRVKKITAKDGVGGPDHVWRYYYVVGEPSEGESYLVETNSNSSGHATCEPNPYFTVSENRPIRARGGRYTPAKVVYEQVTVLEGEATATESAPKGLTVYNFSTSGDYPNGGVYGEVDNSWKCGFLDAIRQYSAEFKLKSETIYEREFQGEPSIYSLPADANFACPGRWFQMNEQNSMGRAILRSVTVKADGVERTTERMYADDEDVDERRDVVAYTKDRVTMTERTWGNVGSPDNTEGAFASYEQLGDPTATDIVAVYSVCGEMRVKIYTDFNTAGESVLSKTFYLDCLPGPGGVARVIGAALWDLNGNGVGDPDLIMPVARDGEMACYVLWDVGDGATGEPSYFSLFRVQDEDWEIVSCAIGNVGGDASKPELLFYEGDYDVTGRTMVRSFYGLRDFGPTGGGTLYPRATITTASGAPWYFGGDDIRFVDHDADGYQDDLEITGPEYEDYVEANGAYLPTEGYCRHYVIRNIAMLPGNPEIDFGEVKRLPTLFEVGPNDEGSVQIAGAYSLRYLGAAELGTNGDRVYGFFVWNDPNTKLRVVEVVQESFSRDLDGRPNRVVVKEAGGLGMIRNSVPAYTVYPQHQLRHIISGSAMETSAEIISEDQGNLETRAVAAGANCWNTLAGSVSEREMQYSPLSHPTPQNGATQVELVCDNVLLEWQGASVNGEEVQYEVYVGGTSSNMPRRATMYNPISSDRIGAQIALLPNTTYYWQVRAFYKNGRVTAGPIWTFSTGQSRAPVSFACGDNEWLEMLGPTSDNVLTPEGLVYIRWLGDNIPIDPSDCHCVNVQYERPDGTWGGVVGHQICSNRLVDDDHAVRDGHWGMVPWRVPAELAGKETRIRIYRHCGTIHPDKLVLSGPIFVAESPDALLPTATYSWRVPSPVSVGVDAEFDFSQSAQNADWVRNQLVTRRGKYGQAIETLDAYNTAFSIIYGYHGTRVVGSVKNAAFDECGILTGEHYDIDEWIDEENAWETSPGSVTASADASHFGEKGLRLVNGYALRNFRLRQGRDYVLSAWIKNAVGSNVPMQKDIVMRVDYRKLLDGANETDWPIRTELEGNSTPLVCSGTLTATGESGKWYHVVMAVPASTDISSADWDAGYKYARAWVGCPVGDEAGNDGELYIDDIRFLPSDALASSTYLTSCLKLPTVTVDANSQPTKVVEYDDFGRPELFRVVKDRHAKVSGNETNLITTKKVEYHVAPCE